MPAVSIQNLLLGLVVVVPGFIATHFAISLGVVRTEISKWRLLIISLSMSLLVDTIFIALLQQLGTRVTDPTDISSIFFTPTFRPLYVLSLILFSIMVGVIGAIGLAANLHKQARNCVWNLASVSRRRNFQEPWEGTLDNAARVQVLTSDGAVVIGGLRQYSDDGKEKQISLTGVEWRSPGSDEWVDPQTDIELLFGDDIRQVTVVDTIENAEDKDD